MAESLRTEVDNRDLRASYVASVYRYHELHMDVLMRLHRARPGRGLAAAAFEASERARARSLLDSLAEAGVDLRQGLDPELLKRERVADEGVRRLGRAPDSVWRRGDAGRTPRRLAEEYRDLEQPLRRSSRRRSAAGARATPRSRSRGR